MKINFFYIGFKSWRLRLKLAKLLSWALLSGFTFSCEGNERVEDSIAEIIEEKRRK